MLLMDVVIFVYKSLLTKEKLFLLKENYMRDSFFIATFIDKGLNLFLRFCLWWDYNLQITWSPLRLSTVLWVMSNYYEGVLFFSMLMVCANYGYCHPCLLRFLLIFKMLKSQALQNSELFCLIDFIAIYFSNKFCRYSLFEGLFFINPPKLFGGG